MTESEDKERSTDWSVVTLIALLLVNWLTWLHLENDL